MSRNHSHFRNGSLNNEARAYKRDCESYLLKNHINLLHLGKKKEIKSIELMAIFHIREDVLYTKQGSISKKSGDDDNLIKLPKDSVFDFLSIDDSLVIHSIYKKIVAVSPQVKRSVTFLIELN